MQVKDVMNTNMERVKVEPGASLSEVVNQMADNHLSCLVVVDGAKPIGVVTERDMTSMFSNYLDDALGKEALIEQLMTPNPVCISENLSCVDALTLSRTRKLRHLPVIDEADQLIGLVTQANLLDAYTALIEKQAKLENSLAELKSLSLEDPLMRIGNRRAMVVDLAFTEAEARRHHKSYAIGLFDIDFFKKYNDLYGHQAGDEALKNVASAIKKAIRDSDRVFRYGGEEILVLMPESTLDAALACGERVRAAVESLEIMHEQSPTGTLTISGGVAAEVEGAWKDLVHCADEALYAAKHNGRNKVSPAEHGCEQDD